MRLSKTNAAKADVISKSVLAQWFWTDAWTTDPPDIALLHLNKMQL